jgi:serine/threonine protein kinase
MAPEILKNHKYDYKVDLWALGILFYQMLFGYPPFTGKDLYDLGKNIRAGNYRIPKNIKMTLDGLDFLNRCL